MNALKLIRYMILVEWICYYAVQWYWILNDDISTYDVEHDVVTQAWGTVDADEDAIHDGSAKAHCQPVRPCAWSLIIGPRVCDQTSPFTEDVSGASWKRKREEIRFVMGEMEADK